jgi:hypothetical protein
MDSEHRAATAAFITARELGWRSSFPAALLAAGIAAGCCFVWAERRQPSPMLPLSMFRSRDFSGATGAGLLFNLILHGVHPAIHNLFSETATLLPPSDPHRPLPGHDRGRQCSVTEEVHCTMMTVDVDDFIVILAARLTAIVPPGFYVEPIDGTAWYSCDQGRFPGQQGSYHVGRAGTQVRANFELYGDTDAERIVGAAAQALDELQDYISEASHDPWPGRTAQPPPYARIRGSMLHLWYGEPDDVVLACEPIPLAALGLPAS